MADSPTIRNHAAFVWSVADLLRGDYKQSEYGKVILPLTVVRRPGGHERLLLHIERARMTLDHGA